LYLPVDDDPLITLMTGSGGVLASGTVSSSFFLIDWLFFVTSDLLSTMFFI